MCSKCELSLSMVLPRACVCVLHTAPGRYTQLFGERVIECGLFVRLFVCVRVIGFRLLFYFREREQFSGHCVRVELWADYPKSVRMWDERGRHGQS